MNVAARWATTLESPPKDRSPRKPPRPQCVGDRREVDVDAGRTERRGRRRRFVLRLGGAQAAELDPPRSHGGAHVRRRIAPPSWSTKISNGRPISQLVACSFAVVAANSAGVQLWVRMTPPISPARMRARNDAFGGPASALTIVAPAGDAAAAGVARASAAALASSQRRSGCTLETQARRRVEIVESARVDREP